jgi:hypothetical protein
MAEAFMYMYFVGAGTAAGVATIGLITWKIVTRTGGVKIPKKKRGIV